MHIYTHICVYIYNMSICIYVGLYIYENLLENKFFICKYGYIYIYAYIIHNIVL